MIVVMNCLSAVSGGAVSYLRNLLPLLHEEFLASDGRNILRVLAHESQLSLFPYLPKSSCHVLYGARPRGLKRLVWEQQNLPKLVTKLNADVHFVPYQIARRVRGVRQVLMLRNMEPFHFRKYKYSTALRLRNHLLTRASNKALSTAERVIAVSGFAEQHLLSSLKLPPGRIRHIYHGRDESFRAEECAEQDARLLADLGIPTEFVLTCGSLLPYRRCEDVVRAFGKVATQRGGLALVIAGSGNDQRYAKLLAETVAKSGVACRIHMLGHVSKEAMQALYRKCKACVIATEIEACPNIAIESLASGCCVIATDQPPLPEMFSGAAIHYAARDINALAGCIYDCLENEEARRNLSAKALTRGLEFSWKRCARETYKALVDW